MEYSVLAGERDLLMDHPFNEKGAVSEEAAPFCIPKDHSFANTPTNVPFVMVRVEGP